MNLGIQDKDITKAFETLISEFSNLEDLNRQLTEDLQNADQLNSVLQDDIEDLREQIKKLEDALAEAHLTGSSDGKES